MRTLAHFSTCHTPRNSMMAEQGDRFLAGGKVGRWTAPNITSDMQAGIGSWSQNDIEIYLRTGALHGKAIAAGDMGTAVQNSFSKLNDSDITAIARYIKQVPAQRGSLRHSVASKPSVQPLSAIETGIKIMLRTISQALP